MRGLFYFVLWRSKWTSIWPNSWRDTKASTKNALRMGTETSFCKPYGPVIWTVTEASASAVLKSIIEVSTEPVLQRGVDASF
jgi:hypothetical protein